MNKVFIISDTHFGHENIIKYCNRKFSNVEEMDKYIIKQWNDTVTFTDIIIHLGDFALCSADKIREYANSLNGFKYLIRGNHDHSTNTFYENCGFTILPHGYKLYPNEKNYILSHKPIEDRLIPEGYTNIHGHIHGTELADMFDREIHKCVSVECLDDYKPMLLLNGERKEVSK